MLQGMVTPISTQLRAVNGDCDPMNAAPYMADVDVRGMGVVLDLVIPSALLVNSVYH